MLLSGEFIMRQSNKRFRQFSVLMKSVAVLYSGGKDSTFAIDLLRRDGFQVSCLITLFSENPDSYMLHTANLNLVELHQGL